MHLSTAILLMLTSGILLWVNLVPARSASTPMAGQKDGVFYAFRSYGWPWKVMVATDEVKREAGKTKILYSGIDAFNYGQLGGDILVALFALGSVGYGCEQWVVRKREPQSHAK
jgi:hypothetical protein